MTWLKVEVFKNVVALAIIIFSFYYYPSCWLYNGLMAGHFYVQGGFLNHDAGHRLLHEDVDTNYLYQWFWSNVVFGANAKWWREEHDIHHSATNTFDLNDKTGFYDPQACEDVFCQADVLVGFFKAFHHPFFLTY